MSKPLNCTDHTRLDKITNLKERNDLNSAIDLFACSTEEIDYLFQMTEREKKETPRSTDDWVYINNFKDKQARKKTTGTWK